jgi:molybdopterin/thiamine biosynthesis adenylyltransferase
MELVKCLNPGIRFSEGELSDAAIAHLGGCPIEDYGQWVFYPWSGKLVHLLAEEEFALLRTDRNKVKINAEEQKRLAEKKIALIGLSVGQSVAITLAMQRGFGELRIADFDLLELSNLNRIRAGVDKLGLPKVAITAREIAEIDPYLKVRCYWEGVTEDNIDSFLNDGGAVDLLIDECDSIEIKVKSRIKARELGIPVIMETSDRGMLDVERFDLESDTYLFHGRLGSDADLLRALKDDPMKTALGIIDVPNASERGRESLQLLGKELSAWPQLAEDVILGGATASKASRKILLGEELRSGRYYVDVNEIITGK